MNINDSFGESPEEFDESQN